MTHNFEFASPYDFPIGGLSLASGGNFVNQNRAGFQYP